MADPVSAMAVGGMVSTAAGGILGAFGAQEQGEAQSKMYQYQAGVARINQKIAEQNADYARAAGEVEAQKSGMETRARVGQIRAAQGASNLDVNTGSAAAVRASQQAVGQEDEAIIRANAARKAYGYEVEATQDKAQVGLDTMAASQSKTAGDIGAMASILGEASSVSSKWMQYKSTFGGGGGSSSIFS